MRKILCLTALAAFLGACGGVDTETEQPSTLVSLRGTVSNPEGLGAPGDLRLAVVWFSRAPSAERTDDEQAFQTFVASDELPLSPEFPASFTLSLRNPPPPGAINETTVVPTGDNAGQRDVDPDLRTVPVRSAVGVIVVYDDRNGNGNLDLVDEQATEFVDDVVGIARRAQLVWFEGPLPADINVPKQKGTPQPGFNFIWATNDVVGNSFSEGVRRFSLGTSAQLEAFDWRPALEPIDVVLSNDAVFDLTMCKITSGTCLTRVSEAISTEGPPSPEPNGAL